MSTKLKGKRAIITGGSGGIGRVIASTLLTEGAEVIIVSRNADELGKAQAELSSFGMVGTFPLDVSDAAAVEQFAHTLAEDAKPIDILVNAAGIYGPIGSIDTNNPVDWLNTIKINLFGTFLMTHYCVPLLKKSSRGVVINFSGGGEGARANLSAYVSSKGGIVRFTETLAEELKSFHIDVNAVTPGAVNTKFLDNLLAAGEAAVGKDAYQEALKQKESGGTSPKKVAELVLWLTSDASRGLTGKLISAPRDLFEEFPQYLTDIMGSDVYTLRRIRPKDRGFGWEKQ